MMSWVSMQQFWIKWRKNRMDPTRNNDITITNPNKAKLCTICGKNCRLKLAYCSCYSNVPIWRWISITSLAQIWSLFFFLLSDISYSQVSYWYDKFFCFLFFFIYEIRPVYVYAISLNWWMVWSKVILVFGNQHSQCWQQIWTYFL